jgi:DHA1 family bicyclomycin/chloramphenicol resistance-like MFS transporter
MSSLLVLILAVLSMLGALSIDAYLPALPAIGKEFAAGPAAVQQSLTIYVFAYAVMTLFYGTLSDSFGRRPVILGSLIVYLASSLGAAFAPSLAALMVFRLLQGLSAGAGTVVGRAMVGDLSSGPEAQRAMSYIAVVFGLAPALAPIIGGWLQATAGWRSIFFFIAGVTLALLIVCLVMLPESLPEEQRQAFHPGAILKRYWEVGGHRVFMLRGLSIAVGFAGVLLYVAAAPAFVLEILGLGVTQFGWLFLPLIGGMTVGSLLSGKLSHRVAAEKLIRAGFAVMIMAAAANVAYCAWGPVRIPWAVAPICLYGFGASLCAPAMTTITLEMIPEARGLAASLQTFLFMILFALTAGVAVPLLFDHPLKLAAASAGGAVFSVALWSAALKKRMKVEEG